MQNQDLAPTLRPLGVGEILDRAVNLTVKFFLPLILIYVAYGIPFAIASYFATVRFSSFVPATSVFNPGSHAPPSFPPEFFIAIAAIAVVFVLTLPLPTAALIESIGAYYLGKPSSFAQAYRVAFERYFQMLALTFFYIGAAIAIYIVFVIVGVLVFLGVALIAAASKFVGIALGVVLGIALALVVIAFLIVVTLMLQIGYFTCVVERATCTDAFARSIKRTLSSIGIQRSLLIGLVYFAIVFGLGIVSFSGQLAFQGLLHSVALGYVFAVVLRVVTAVLITSFLTVFYFDLRVREEGLDLEFAAANIDPSPAATRAT